MDGKKGIGLFAVLLLGLFTQIAAAEGPASADILVPAPKGSAQAHFFSLLQPFLRKHPKLGPAPLSYVSGRGGAYALNRLGGLPNDGDSVSGVFFPAYSLQSAKGRSVFSTDEVAPVVMLASVPVALWVKETTPRRALADVVAAARANPYGMSITGVGSDTDHNMTSLLFDRAAGVNTVYLPGIDSSKNSEVVNEGKADAAWGYALSPAFMPGLRAVAVAAPARSPMLPDVPTFDESGVPLHVALAIGIALPASAPSPVRERTSDFFMESVMGDSDFIRRIKAEGFTATPVPYSGMEDFLKQQNEAAEKFLQDYGSAGN